MRYVNGAQQFAGYNARISFRISLTELDRADEIAEGLVAAGMNEIEQISFETSKLKEERAKTRRMAVAAAIEKAENYCSAAGVTLGSVIRIQDMNPTALQGHGHGGQAPEPDAAEEDVRGALDPSLIEIGAAVNLTFEIIKGS